MAELLNNSFQELTPEMLKTQDGVNILNNIIKQLVDNVPSDLENVRIFKGYGTPESSVTAGVGSLYMRVDGSAGTTTYQKQTGTGNTGWVAVPGGSGSYSLTVEEQDGAPSVADVVKIKFPNGKVTDNGSGVVSVTVGDGDVVGPSSATDNAITRFDSTTGKLIQNSNAILSDLGRLDVSITDTVDVATIGINVVADKNAATGTNSVIGTKSVARNIPATITQSLLVGVLGTTANIDGSGVVTNAYGGWFQDAPAGGATTNNYAAGFGGKILLEPTGTSPGSASANATYLETTGKTTKIVGDFHINGSTGDASADLILGNSTSSLSNSITADTTNGSFTPFTFSKNGSGDGTITCSASNRMTANNIATGTLAGSATIPSGGAYFTGYTIDAASGRICQAQMDKTTNTTFTQVGSGTADDLVVNVTAGKWYTFQVKLFVNADAVGGHKYSIGGTATATSIIYNVNSIDNTADAFVINARQTALAASSGQAGATSIYTEINGSILVNAAGTLNVEFAQNASNGTSSVLVGSSFFVKQMF